MKKTLLTLTGAAALLVMAACDQPATPETPAAPDQEVTATNGPKVGDKIGESASEKQAKREASIAAKAAAAAAMDEDLAKRGVTKIGWEDLMPEGEEERLAQMYQSQMSMLYGGAGVAEGSAADTMVQIGTFNTVKELDGKKVRIPGYTVPFEYGSKSKITEFLLVPYFGACIHSPPPPPNQTVFVIAEEAFSLQDLAQAVWIEGTIHTQTQESELADAAYTFKMTAVEKYEY